MDCSIENENLEWALNSFKITEEIMSRPIFHIKGVCKNVFHLVRIYRICMDLSFSLKINKTLALSTSICVAMLDNLGQGQIMRRSPVVHPGKLDDSPESFSSLLRFIEESNSQMDAAASQFPQHGGTVQASPSGLNAAIKQESIEMQREKSPFRPRNNQTERKLSVFDSPMNTSNMQTEYQNFLQIGALPQELTSTMAVPLPNQQQLGQGRKNHQGMLSTSLGAQSAQNRQQFASSIAGPQTSETFPPGLPPKIIYGALNFGLFMI